jgi:hypothetical protein
MKQLVLMFVANLFRARLEFLYDLTKEHTTDYQKGKRDMCMLLIQDIANLLESEGICKAQKFINEALPKKEELVSV